MRRIVTEAKKNGKNLTAETRRCREINKEARKLGIDERPYYETAIPGFLYSFSCFMKTFKQAAS
jgi:hypothetical protein